MIRIIVVLLFLTGIFTKGFSQTQDPSNAEVLKNYNAPTYFTTLRLDYYFKERGSYLYWEGNYNTNPDYALLSGRYAFYNMIGYEHHAGGKWYLGLSENFRFDYTKGNNSLITKFNISHRGKIKSIDFIKELSAEYLYYLSNSAGQQPNAQGRIGLGSALHKKFNFKKSSLGFMFSYRVYLCTDFRDADLSIYSNRTFDLTRMRFDVYYGINKNIYVGLFAMRETEYYYTLGGFDSQMNVIPDYRINKITPTFGLTLNYIFHPENSENIIPGLPFR